MNVKIIAAVTILALPLAAQLAPPNTEGVSAAQIHLYVHDIDAQQRFWTALGGKRSHDGFEFPGIYIVLEKRDPIGGSGGSVVDHIGLKVKDLNAALATLKAVGIDVKSSTVTGRFLNAPDDIRVEISENSSLGGTVAMHHIHMFLPDAKAAQAWYVKYFGAVAGERSNGKNRFVTATIPGAEISITPKDTLLAPTKGRVLDSIGFEVQDIKQFVQILETGGIHIEGGIHKRANNVVSAVLTDPWGTRIELTQGLRSAQRSAIFLQRKATDLTSMLSLAPRY